MLSIYISFFLSTYSVAYRLPSGAAQKTVYKIPAPNLTSPPLPPPPTPNALPDWAILADEDHLENIARRREEESSGLFLEDLMAEEKINKKRFLVRERVRESGTTPVEVEKENGDSISFTLPKGLYLKNFNDEGRIVSPTAPTTELSASLTSAATPTAPIAPPTAPIAPQTTPIAPTAPTNRSPTSYKKWGSTVASPEEAYWFDPRIHNFGNTGLSGAFHAAIAPFATKLIDRLAYDSRDIRDEISAFLADGAFMTKREGERKILDIGCGVGMSTRALKKHFKDADVLGLDTSPEMLRVAKLRARIQGNEAGGTGTLSYLRGNGERTLFPDSTFDVVTIMYAFHECPKLGRYKVLREARRLLKKGGRLAVVDISPCYEPSKQMLSGEPYVLEFQKNFLSQLKMTGLEEELYRVVIPKHVAMWVMRRT